MSLDEIQTFWVEPTGRWEVEFDDGRKITTDYEPDHGKPPGWSSASPLYRLPDGSECSSGDLPIGAMFDGGDAACRKGPDGIALWVMCPDVGEGKSLWMVDGRAGNCTMKDDDTHYCWVRHGDPRKANITVDKDGPTCQAGAGSIWMSMPHGWHGFLWNGKLVRERGQNVAVEAPRAEPPPAVAASVRAQIDRVRFSPSRAIG